MQASELLMGTATCRLLNARDRRCHFVRLAEVVAYILWDGGSQSLKDSYRQEMGLMDFLMTGEGDLRLQNGRTL